MDIPKKANVTVHGSQHIQDYWSYRCNVLRNIICTPSCALENEQNLEFYQEGIFFPKYQKPQDDVFINADLDNGNSETKDDFSAKPCKESNSDFGVRRPNCEIKMPFYFQDYDTSFKQH